jgi:hypothetical protein
METRRTSAWMMISLVIGAAVGLGAGAFAARACKTKSGKSFSGKGIRPGNQGDNGTLYCAVPEGADICYDNDAPYCAVPEGADICYPK